MGLPVEDRKCPFCPVHVDNEMHFLLKTKNVFQKATRTVRGSDYSPLKRYLRRKTYYDLKIGETEKMKINFVCVEVLRPSQQLRSCRAGMKIEKKKNKGTNK